MPAELLVPRVSPAMGDATVVEWIKKEGDPVAKDEIVVMIESEKASQDVESLIDGVLYKILAQPGDIVPVNRPLAIIRLPQDTAEDLLQYGDSALSTSTPAKTEAPLAPPSWKADGRVKISPPARRLAASKGIDVTLIPVGSGPGGRIVEKDVMAYCESLASVSVGSAPDSDDRHIPLSALRRHTISTLRQSKERTIPVTSVTEIDLTALLELYRQKKSAWEEMHKVKVTLNAFFVKAVALALRQHEILNSTLGDNDIVVKRCVNIGLAMHVNESLYVPVIKSADCLSVLSIAQAIADFVQKIERKAITSADMADGTFTVTNVGPLNVLLSTPIIVYPQVGILGIGKISERPAFVGETIVKQHLCYFSLTYDHQVVDGVPAASFRETLRQLLERPAALLS
jgi:pyruvate/2-oxoglutarate dehydrogenase complex dihydrolipoamide acyltransferase (E2) component